MGIDGATVHNSFCGSRTVFEIGGAQAIAPKKNQKNQRNYQIKQKDTKRVEGVALQVQYLIAYLEKAYEIGNGLSFYDER